MKETLKKIIKSLRIDEYLYRNKKTFRFFAKVFPAFLVRGIKTSLRNHTEFPSNDLYLLTRGQVNFEINRSDFVQWKIFQGNEDVVLTQAKFFAKPGSIVLDAGANIGGFSLRLAKHCLDNKKQIQIHAFEPNQNVFSHLEKNLRLNPDASALIQIHACGLGRAEKVHPFELPLSNSGAGRVVQFTGDMTVQINRLDDLVEKFRVAPISFIKLIIEGLEPEALSGGWSTIQKNKPPIFLEVTPSWWGERGNRVEDVLASLSKLGYQFKIEQKGELINYESEKHASLFQYNLLAYQ